MFNVLSISNIIDSRQPQLFISLVCLCTFWHRLEVVLASVLTVWYATLIQVTDQALTDSDGAQQHLTIGTGLLFRFWFLALVYN
jgi:hypothetical protein